MHGLKLYPDFTLQERASKTDQNILALLSRVRDKTAAQYVNYSIVDYSGAARIAQHYISYPVYWMSIYLKHHFQEIDPLLNIDYRVCSMIDWDDFWQNEDDAYFYQAIQDAGIGSHGITLNNYIGNNRYGALSLIFNKHDNNWLSFRDTHLVSFRNHADQFIADMETAIGNNNNLEIQLTRREYECLYWAAIGKTDHQIGDMLGIGRWTVNTHINKSKSKLNCPNRTSAVAKAISLNLIDISKAS